MKQNMFFIIILFIMMMTKCSQEELPPRNEVEIYPNPCFDVFNLYAHSTSYYKIISVDNKIIKEDTIQYGQLITINVKNELKGIMVVEITTNAINISTQIIRR